MILAGELWESIEHPSRREFHGPSLNELLLLSAADELAALLKSGTS